MLTTHLEVLEIVAGSLPGQQIVAFGVAAVEADNALAEQAIRLVLDYGDGSTPLSIGPITGTSGRYDLPVDLSLARSGSRLTLDWDLLPYTGKFQLRVTLSGSPTLTALIDGRATALEVATELGKVTGALFGADGRILSAEATGSGWIVQLATDTAAQAVEININSLRSAHVKEHSYPAGNFAAKLTAYNYRSPIADTVQALVELNLASATPLSAQPLIVGPILPADAGFPNADQWNFNLSADLKVLASSVKMILITTPGERVMLPDYGCDVRRLLFDPNDASTERDISDSVRNAVTRWEPRVDIVSLTVTRSGTIAEASLILVSKLNRERFQLKVELAA